jgi:hypothetical protein
MMPDAAVMRDTERRRLRSLVEADYEAADALHADDYQLITPAGDALTKQEYLRRVVSRDLHYLIFEPVSEIAVWGSAEVAAVRYTARISLAGPGEPFTCWHTDCYQMRDGRWQAVWSQATAITRGTG